MGTALAVAGVGAIGSIIGGNAKAKAAKNATAVQREQLDFDKSRYEDWKEVYGVLQEDMGEYYKNLTGTSLSNREIEQIQIADQKAKEQLHKELTNRGIDGSGVEAQLLATQTYQTAMNKANSRATAEDKAMQKKQQFLAIGLGQGNAIAGQMAQSSNNIAQTTMASGDASATMWGGITGSIQGGINAWDANRNNTSTGG